MYHSVLLACTARVWPSSRLCANSSRAIERLAVDVLEAAKLALHLAVVEVVLDTRLAAAPDATCEQRAVALGRLLVGAEADVLVVLHRARVALRLGHRLLRKERRVVVRPDVALRRPPALLVGLGDRGRCATLGEEVHQLTRARIDELTRLET
eukprot:7389407-Prymnesium_polylepis.1